MTNANKKPHTHKNAGFTLIEVMVATVIVGVGLVSTSWTMSNTSRVRSVLVEAPYTATRLAREIRDLAASLPAEPSGVTGVTVGADAVALDNLLGAEFSPPILADRSKSDEDSWSQQVDIVVYDLANLAVPNGRTVADELGENEICQLVVTIQHEGQDVETFRWWIQP